jgi:hypothetical protein
MMAMGRNVGLGVLGGATTMLVRRASRAALHDRRGRPMLPAGVRRQHGVRTMLMWAAVTGLILALADILQEQRTAVAHES